MKCHARNEQAPLRSSATKLRLELEGLSGCCRARLWGWAGGGQPHCFANLHASLASALLSATTAILTYQAPFSHKHLFSPPQMATDQQQSIWEQQTFHLQMSRTSQLPQIREEKTARAARAHESQLPLGLTILEAWGLKWDAKCIKVFDLCLGASLCLQMWEISKEDLAKPPSKSLSIKKH